METTRARRGDYAKKSKEQLLAAVYNMRMIIKKQKRMIKELEWKLDQQSGFHKQLTLTESRPEPLPPSSNGREKGSWFKFW